MNLDLFNYDLPDSAIAQSPADPRDSSKLMLIDRKAGLIEHHVFSDLPQLLGRGDLLVFNDSRVIRARLHGHKIGAAGTIGAQIELLLVHPLVGHDINSSDWLVLAKPARRLKCGDLISFIDGFEAEVLSKSNDGTVHVRFLDPSGLESFLEAHGEMPLPPYIKAHDDKRDSERYQTVYASDPGSVAAPTAGLHFTEGLLKSCTKAGIETARVTLHVGLGTFRPVQSERIEDHQMHEEFYHISGEAATQINQALAEGRRIVCVGTTSVRSLESAAVMTSGQRTILPGWASTDIFIYPGYKFKIVDALITNFHLPQSTLLMLVSAFYNREKILEIYKTAINSNYRFFSYGDAMLIV
ncbi:MAG: tRNA preQ1(34) S-adenosylmethionine ribosyltransferase-isomerase QueA [Coriobacteriales bacterium]|jgi:S-adenosylmethionine:tRNA ribosyltransferase-isomerase|nr:tRNA preQ1(34) S-adenosylmethionine ribosyltransferase-isomerase QueA [Coriobacteriales bacterium]